VLTAYIPADLGVVVAFMSLSIWTAPTTTPRSAEGWAARTGGRPCVR
jgi:hypothetical protein